jgi:hypothetical protein
MIEYLIKIHYILYSTLLLYFIEHYRVYRVIYIHSLSIRYVGR